WCVTKYGEPGSLLLIAIRFAAGGCMPSFTAMSHAPAYHTHVTPFAESVSPMVFCVCGGRIGFEGSAKRVSPPGAGGTRDGWDGGLVGVRENPAGGKYA